MNSNRLILAVCFLVNFCANSCHNQSFVDENFRLQPLSADLGSESALFPVFWRNAQFQLRIKKTWAQRSEDTLLAMLSFTKNTPEQQRLLKDERVLLFHLAESNDTGFALFALDRFADLEELSRYTHDGRGLGCGRLELISLSRALLATPSRVDPAIYDESVSLAAVKELISAASRSNIEASVTTLEDIGTRYHSKATGLTTPNTIQGMFEDAVAGGLANIEYELVTHSQTSQKSLVVRLPGNDPDAPMVILGAHLDSINSSTSNSYAPGADDDASGVAVLIEVMRVLAQAQVSFERTVELHLYAAEEVGLVGSADIAASYKSDKKDVAAMLQLDMTSYAEDADSETIYLVSTDTSPLLLQTLKDLLNTYLGGDYEVKALAAGTSDHKSWTNSGYAAVFPFEDPDSYNETLHTSNDTVAYLDSVGMDFSLATRFAKLAIAFLSHYAGLESAAQEYSAATYDFPDSSDVKLAIMDTDDTKKFQIAASSTSKVETLTACTIESASGLSCSDAKLSFTKLGSLGGRNIFLTEDAVKLSHGQKMRFFAYDKNGKLSEVRNILLEKK